MRNRCCVWAFLALWMCLLAAGASGESMIEVDENGDEYELKRFYIQGRQLSGDGSQSQCVVTRRKRSGRALQSGSGSASGSVSVSSQPLKVESLPAKEHREGGAVLQEVENSNRRYVALTGVHLESPIHDNEEEEEDVEENDDDQDEDEVEGLQSTSKSQSNFVPAALALPLQQQTSSAAHLNQGVSVVANAASHANVAEDAGIVVVQSHQPPKVNPDTHAVFELKPVQSDVDQSSAVSFYPFVQPWEVVDQYGDDYDEDDYDEEDYDDFHYGGYDGGFFRDQPGFQGLGAYEEHIISEDQPISTIASWVTGEDDSDIGPVVNKRPNHKNKKNQKNKNKNQNQNQKNRRQQQKKRKQEAQEEEELTTKRKQKKPQQQDKDKDQKKKKQDKDQKKKKPEQNLENQEVDATPIEVIKKPVAMDSASAVVVASSSSSTSGNSSGSNSTDQQKKKKKKKKKPASSSSSSSSLSQRRTKKKKKQSSSSSSISMSSSSSNKRRRPSSNIGSSSSSSSSIGGYRRRRPQQQQLQQQRRRKTQQQKRRRQQQQQKRRRQQQQQQRRRLRNKNRQFYGDEPIINCIYINKDAPTTTTPRPFWNILGRQSESESNSKSVNPAESSVASSSEESPVDPVAQQAVLQAVRRNFNEFGGRKRTNLRFVS